jgi:hypothetical protein
MAKQHRHQDGAPEAVSGTSRRGTEPGAKRDDTHHTGRRAPDEALDFREESDMDALGLVEDKVLALGLEGEDDDELLFESGAYDEVRQAFRKVTRREKASGIHGAKKSKNWK